MPRSLIVGVGEVGRALSQVLREGGVTVDEIDLNTPPVKCGDHWVMHVCLRYRGDFLKTVRGYAQRYKPDIIDVCTTCPPGTTERLGEIACHSTTRGLHPNLAESLRTFTKHIGGPLAPQLAQYYNAAWIKTQVHATARTTELAHVLCNAIYGVNIMFHDEAAKICRDLGVDFHEAVTMYNMTCNEGYRQLGHSSKMRMLLYPPENKIGGHCVKLAGQLLEKLGGPIIKLLAHFGEANASN